MSTRRSSAVDHRGDCQPSSATVGAGLIASGLSRFSENDPATDVVAGLAALESDLRECVADLADIESP
jgi:hypothetical protein